MTTEFIILRNEETEEDDPSVIGNATKIVELASSIADDAAETAMALSLAVVLFSKANAEKSSLREILYGIALAYTYFEGNIELIPASKGTSAKH